MRIKTTIKDKNKTDVQNKTKKKQKKQKIIYIYILFTFFKHTETKLSYTFWNEHLYSSVPPSRIRSKPNNILFLILIECLLLLSEDVTANISKCYPFPFFPFHVQLHCFLKEFCEGKELPRENCIF